MIEVCVPKVLREVIDEQVATLRPLLLGGRLWLLDTKHAAVGVGGAVTLQACRRVAVKGAERDRARNDSLGDSNVT